MKQTQFTLTRAVLGQVFVFALLFFPKWAAGLAALSGLAFTRHPPAVQTEIRAKMGTLRLQSALYADITSCQCDVRLEDLP